MEDPFDDLDIDEAIQTSMVRRESLEMESPDDLGIRSEEIAHLGLSFVTTSFERVAKEEGKKGLQRLALVEVLDGPWPAAAKHLRTIRGIIRENGGEWEVALTHLGFQPERANQIIRVYDQLLDLQLDPGRFAHIPVAVIDANIPKVRRMANRADMACHLRNLGAEC